MDRPFQPQFKIRILNNRLANADTGNLSGTGVSVGTDGYIDIERCVAPGVTYSESADLLCKLNFRVYNYAEILLYYFHIGQSVIFYGGHYSEDERGMKKVFAGNVTRVKTSFGDNGNVEFTVECMSYGFVKMGKSPMNCVYPDMNSKRTWAQKPTLKVMDIIKGIADDNGFQIGKIDFSIEAKKIEYSKTNIRYQKNESDWNFLSKLAKDLGCTLWISTENDEDRLNFVSYEKACRQQEDIVFIYPLYGVIKDIKDDAIKHNDNPTYNRPRLIREVTVEEDMAAADGVSRSAVYFDKNTGEEISCISKIETDNAGNRTVTFYELDEQKVAQVDKEMPDVADSIRNNGPSSLPWGTSDNPRNAAYYYKAIKHYEEHQAVFDKAFFGITLSAKTTMDLNIHINRTYRVRGVLSYFSKDLDSSFLLRSLVHSWDSDGCWTELDFMR